MPTFLCGHGMWHPKEGYTQVPAGSKITFYTNNIKKLYQEEALKILDGSTQFDPDKLDVREALASVPEMTLSDAGAEFRQKCELAAKRRTRDAWKLVFADAGNPKKLSEVFRSLPAEELVWVACREVELKKVIVHGARSTFAGALIGVNLRENPTTLYSAYIVGGSGRPEAVDKGTFRGFMPPSWNIPRPQK
jgi:hypothetical protein